MDFFNILFSAVHDGRFSLWRREAKPAVLRGVWKDGSRERGARVAKWYMAIET